MSCGHPRDATHERVAPSLRRGLGSEAPPSVVQGAADRPGDAWPRLPRCSAASLTATRAPRRRREYGFRFACCPKRWNFFITPLNMVDLLRTAAERCGSPIVTPAAIPFSRNAARLPLLFPQRRTPSPYLVS